MAATPARHLRRARVGARNGGRSRRGGRTDGASSRGGGALRMTTDTTAVASSPRPASQVYTWEPSNRSIAARYGLEPAEILRFDTNTSPAEPGFVHAVLSEPFDPTLNEYPDSSYEELTAA